MSNIELWTIDMDKHVIYQTCNFPVLKGDASRKLVLDLIRKWKDSNVVDHLGEANDETRIFHLEKDGEHVLISSTQTTDKSTNAVMFIRTSPDAAEEDFFNMKSEYLLRKNPVRH